MIAPVEMGRFAFVTLAALRTTQLMRGCTPRVEGHSKLTTTAQREVADGKIRGIDSRPADVPPR